MEKDIDRIQKNPETDIVIRIDDFNGRKGLTIREFVKSERYTGFTKAGTRIPADKFAVFKAAINSIDENDLKDESGAGANRPMQTPQKQSSLETKKQESKQVKKPMQSSDMEETEF